MFKNIFKLPVIILLFLSGYVIFAKANPPVSNNSHPHKQASFARAICHSPGQEFANINSTPLQIASLQRHKTVHSIKCIDSLFNVAVIQIKYIHFICGTYSSELSRFRKLILFPFHAFW
ncbi:hypothetical protein SAMN05216490_1542 [Mucilaginibacter mallensis]|uniref:Uncharacterized protein n=1 Tax=Mucilaginibacter mallensis TaxID=652787 RepID=A0A1H1TXD7_MUCMA|nr:hypothetical protein [Mucilaginibacter mallensis]SDS64852.1 hypothetical protein SAMN05216490_1542 [Mucilaginibacter mallensis]